MISVFCQIKARLYWVGSLPLGKKCTVEWIGQCTGIDPDNVKTIERQPKRWLITLVNP